ncbi:MAG: hypothetical protein Q4C98_05610 [Capnocytophaga sp.]|nr:hypothetical protein [Capnocytophaga sp.]
MKDNPLNINEIEVNTRQDFARFLVLLQHDLQENPHEWENRTLSDFLEALSRYTEDIEYFYKNTQQNINADTPSWRVFADIFRGAKVYE